jgi:hypothetical protein
MKTKNIIIIASLTIISLILGLFWVVAPTPMKDKIIGLFTFASAERKCFNYYKNDYFKDPDSAYIDSSRILTREHDGVELEQYPLLDVKYKSVVQIKVLARNSMGGYAVSDIMCPLEENNTFWENSTTIYLMKVANEQSKKETCTKAEKIGRKYLTAQVIDYCSGYYIP